MKIVRSVLILAASLFLGSALLSAQSIDLFAGLNAVTASQAIQNIPRLGGGLFPSAGANLHLLGDLGVGAEVAFRASQSNSQQNGLRPVYYDVNLVVTPITLSRSIVPEFLLGVGAQNLSVYPGLTQCGSLANCSTYASSHNLTAHLGIVLKLYLTEHIYLSPEAHFYFIRHNTQFQASNADRFGISLGYTLGH